MYDKSILSNSSRGEKSVLSKKGANSMSVLQSLGQGMCLDFHSVVDETLAQALRLFRNEPKWQGRSGAYFCVSDATTGIAFFTVLIGGLPIDMADVGLVFCQEKARRLASHPDHVASWESRDENTKQYGGAIRCGNYILSLSGLPELGDEAVMLAVADAFLKIKKNLRDTIAAQSKNPYWPSLRLCMGLAA